MKKTFLKNKTCMKSRFKRIGLTSIIVYIFVKDLYIDEIAFIICFIINIKDNYQSKSNER